MQNVDVLPEVSVLAFIETGEAAVQSNDLVVRD